MKLSEFRVKYLKECRDRYKDFCQDADPKSVFMEANGHPMADDYRRLRNYFESLMFPCNAGARFIYWRNVNDFAGYWKPDLKITLFPYGEFTNKYNLYPSLDGKWQEYLEAAAKENWPEFVQPSINPGSFVVRTPRYNLIARISATLGSPVQYAEDKNGWFKTQFFPKTVKEVERIIKLLEKTGGKSCLKVKQD